MSSLFDISIIEQQLSVCGKNDLKMIKELVNNHKITSEIPKNIASLIKKNMLRKQIISIIFDEDVDDRIYERDMLYYSYCIILFKNDISLQITLVMDDDECRGLSSQRYSYIGSYLNNNNNKKIIRKNALKIIAKKIDKNIEKDFDSFIDIIEKYMSIQNFLQYEHNTGATIPEIIYDPDDEINYEKTINIWDVDE